MGFLDGSTITVDAILTKHGRKKLAQGNDLGITKFSLSDDGVDYTLWNPDHASGSDSYGEAINALPNIEAVPDDSVIMKYKLMTMDRDRVFLPYLNISPTAVTISRQGAEGAQTVHITTYNFGPEAYTWTYDANWLSVNAPTTAIGGTTHQFNENQEIPNPVTAGPATSLTLIAKPLQEERKATIEVYGVSSGAIGFLTVTGEYNIRQLPNQT